MVLLVFERANPSYSNSCFLKSIFHCKDMWFVFCNTVNFFYFSVPEILDRKYFHKEGVCVYYTKFKRPPQVNDKWCKNSLMLFNIKKVNILISVGLVVFFIFCKILSWVCAFVTGHCSSVNWISFFWKYFGIAEISKKCSPVPFAASYLSSFWCLWSVYSEGSVKKWFLKSESLIEIFSTGILKTSL